MTKKLLQHTKAHNTRHIISQIHTYITPTVHTHHPKYSTTHCTKCMRLKYIQIMHKILLQFTKAHNTRHIISRIHTYITPTVHTHHPRYSTTHCTKCMRLKYIQILPKILLQYTKAHNTRHIISHIHTSLQLYTHTIQGTGLLIVPNACVSSTLKYFCNPPRLTIPA